MREVDMPFGESPLLRCTSKSATLPYLSLLRRVDHHSDLVVVGWSVRPIDVYVMQRDSDVDEVALVYQLPMLHLHSAASREGRDLPSSRQMYIPIRLGSVSFPTIFCSSAGLL